MSQVKAVAVTRDGDVVVSSIPELEKLLESVEVEVLIIVRGEVLSVLKAVEAPRASGVVESQERAPQARPELKPAPRVEGGRASVAVVLDQMFRGFSSILDRELRNLDLEIHEVVGRGLQATLKVSDRIYQEPANDDFDVLKLVENLAARARVVVFFTGDKKLARQASALGLGNVVVKYMPPNEYPGKESLAKAMIDAVSEAAEGA